jgi:hypothetical protein
MVTPAGVTISLVSRSGFDMSPLPLIVNWTAWTDAKSEKAARAVAARLFAALHHPVEHEAFARYDNTGGWRFTFQTRLVEATRNDGLVATSALGMRVGYSWTLNGDVFATLEGWSNAARVSGVTNLQWQLLDEAAHISE